jgi:hypothetical protein
LIFLLFFIQFRHHLHRKKITITLTFSNAIDLNYLKQALHISANEPDKSVQAQPQAQVFYANVGGKIQEVAANSAIMNGNKAIKLLMNMPGPGSFNPSGQVQLVSGSLPTKRYPRCPT